MTESWQSSGTATAEPYAGDPDLRSLPEQPPAPPRRPRPHGERVAAGEAAQIGLLLPPLSAHHEARPCPVRAQHDHRASDGSAPSCAARSIPARPHRTRPGQQLVRISAEASSHCCRSRLCSNRSALCTAMPAAAARASTRISSSAVNSAVPTFRDRTSR